MSPADIEALRAKVLRRALGMTVLVVLGAIGFSWLFETQPRPLASDIQVVNAANQASMATQGGPASSSVPSEPAPVVLPAIVAHAPDAALMPPAGAGASRSSREQAPSAPVVTPAPAPAPASDEEIIDEPASAPRAEDEDAKAKAEAKEKAAEAARLKAQAAREAAQAKAKQEAKAKLDAKIKAEAKAKAEAKVKAEAKAKQEAKLKADAKAKVDEKAKVAAKPEAKPEAKPKPEADTRYIVQVGAYSDAKTAHEARMKVERLGIKTYTQQVDAGGSKKIRVRVGPFANKAEADKTMNALRKAGLPAGLLTL
jgi:DedD protein